MNVALFAKRDFADLRKLKRSSCIGVGFTSNDKLPCKRKEGEKTHCKIKEGETHGEGEVP